MLQIIIVQNWHIKTSHGEHNFHILPANYLLWVLKEFNSSQHFDDRWKKKKKRKKRKEKNISWIKQGWIYPKDKILPCIRILKSGFFFFFSLIEYHDIFQKKKKKKNACIELRLSHEIFSVESFQNITLYLKNGDRPISCISFPFSLETKTWSKGKILSCLIPTWSRI